MATQSNVQDLVTLKFGGTDLSRKINKYSVMLVCTQSQAPALNCIFLKNQFLLGSYKQHFFWKYELEVPIMDFECSVQYSFTPSKIYEFYVPAFNQPYNLAFTSCNGLSSSVSPAAVKNNGIKPLWNDINRMHKQIRYHGMIGGGVLIG
jgi:hypothetical protein